MFQLLTRRSRVRQAVVIPAALATLVTLGACGSSGKDPQNVAADQASAAPAAATDAGDNAAGAAIPGAADAVASAPQGGVDAAKPAADKAPAATKPSGDKPADTKAGAGTKAAGSTGAKTSKATSPEAALTAQAMAYKVPALKAVSGSPVLIGNVGTYSGVGGLLNRGTQETLRVWSAWVNAHGGLNGHPVTVESYDDQGDPATAVTRAKELASKGAIAFLWNYSLFTSQTLIPAIEKLKIPWIGGDDFDPEMYATQYMYPNNVTPYYQDAATGAYAASLGKKTAAVWWCIEAYVCRQAQKYDDSRGGLASVGMKVVMNVSVSLTQPSYLSQCSTAKQKGVEYIMDHVDGASFIRAAQDCAQIGYHPMFCNVAGAVTPELLTSEFKDQFCFSVSSWPWWASETPMQKEFHSAISKYAPGAPSTYGSSGTWASGEILRYASKFLSAKPTADELVKGLNTVTNMTFGGLTYPLTYSQSPKPTYNCGQVAIIPVVGQWGMANNNKLYCAPLVPLETLTKQ
jgi:branched-chain amino acid transport system substrate-binding protein